jgi:hypothetical protein
MNFSMVPDAETGFASPGDAARLGHVVEPCQHTGVLYLEAKTWQLVLRVRVQPKNLQGCITWLLQNPDESCRQYFPAFFPLFHAACFAAAPAFTRVEY